jgi:NitT/TauT family transport system substrate-binding protein
MASQVSDAFQTKTRINPDAVWNGSYLPSAAALNILPAPKAAPAKAAPAKK